MKGSISRKSLKLTVYTVVFTLFLAVFTYSGFPVEALKMRIISEIKKNSPYDVEIAGMSFPASTHMGFEGVELKKGNNLLKLNKVVLSPGITDLITDNVSVPFVAEGLGGNFTGTMHFSRNDRSIKDLNLKFSGIDARSVRDLFDLKQESMDIKGDIDGTLVVDFSKKGKNYTAQGRYKFNSDDLTISNIKIESFSLPGYKNLNTELKGTFDSQKTKIDKLNFRNEDFELSFFGTMPPVWELSRGGKLDLFMNLNLYSQEAKISFLKAFLSPQRDGTLAAKILGTVSNPRLVKGEQYEF